MSNEKPVELTEAERAALMHHIGGWKFERQGLANAEDAFMAEVARIVKAREAAARREALLEVEGGRSLDHAWAVALKEQGRVHRVLALAAALQEQYEASDYSETASLGEMVKAIRAALAEPERDEEGGR